MLKPQASVFSVPCPEDKDGANWRVGIPKRCNWLAYLRWPIRRGRLRGGLLDSCNPLLFCFVYCYILLFLLSFWIVLLIAFCVSLVRFEIFACNGRFVRRGFREDFWTVSIIFLFVMVCSLLFFNMCFMFLNVLGCCCCCCCFLCCFSLQWPICQGQLRGRLLDTFNYDALCVLFVLFCCCVFCCLCRFLMFSFVCDV